MAVTAVYFVAAAHNAPGVAELTDRLIRAFDPVPAGNWGLHHRSFRSTPQNTTDKSPPHFQHVLALGHYPDRAFVHIAGPDQQQDQQQQDHQQQQQPSTVAIPLQQMEQYSQLLSLKFGALWMYRMGSQVGVGASYSVGEFTVRLGELREKGGQNALRGTVVCIQTAKQESRPDEGEAPSARIDADEELQAGQALVRDVWSRFSVPQFKETITSRPAAPEADDQLFDEVRLWCEALRFQK
ncbi:mediator complex subunit med20 protein [Diplodia corticola]|uniref:Mediator of RNA polymerase II transcription subunit 20 n=1 Tax=Diplodia corticola TaxID=236234 RepID=A0A1J9RRU7_9PEZI|nr:mediator complex subunit med20 protein [Diplodia corticola]OJD30253.1 mediator complex subunit med20 protein [Diplodia corticola]